MIKKWLNIQDKRVLNEPRCVENQIEGLYNSLIEDTLCIYIGNDIVSYKEKLEDKFEKFRDELFEQNGFIIPPIRVMNVDSLQENEYRIFIRGEISYIGYTLINGEKASEEITDALRFLCAEQIDKIFTNEIVEKYIETVQKNNGLMIWNLTNALPLWGIRLVLVNLIKEGKSIRKIVEVFEKMSKIATSNRETNYKADPYMVSRRICKEFKQ